MFAMATKTRDNYRVTPCLNKLLKVRGMTQLDLQDLSGVPQASISRFDSNRRHEDIHLVAISKALNVRVEELFVIERIPCHG